ncbi:MBL fold metallo-hydrolase [Nocardia sp. NPDC050378]|uniref:MBL fold metallo-hydrolase n=1 Tax=Nocardia sp. NPDC050378 TaxID=3155400 RepID=UPI0033FABAED
MPETGRRRFLKTLTTTAVAGGALAVGASAAACAAPENSPAVPDASGYRTKLVLLGTAGGPLLLDGARAGISTAVVYEDRTYIVDLGMGSLHRLTASGLGHTGAPASALTRVRGVLFTHLHSDHFLDWPALYSVGSMNSTGNDGARVKVFGPGDRGTLPRVYPPNRQAPPVYYPEDPTPGITGMTGHLRRAFAQDFNDRARDGNMPDPERIFDIRDIDLAGVWDVDPQGIPPRLSEPLHIWEDDAVRITATLVDHHPIAPAFAYRFDTPDGSVVISGDTTVSENLIDLAQGCDYLVHEVIDPQFVEETVTALPDEIAGPAREHLLGAHTTIEQVGRDVAEPAGAKNLVLTHLAPANNPESRWQAAQQGYSGRLIVGQDLMQLGVGTG